MSQKSEFDVFLAHNSKDKPFVRLIAEELKRFGLKPWIDEEEILPGQYFQDAIQDAGDSIL
ncbi:MAG: TIR domain-containing protein, partial [Leptolyngbya sp. SIO4C1]|nr:TIR domain-containing protein [Leptolyngbya sp. SIO4C1]